jgi:hypothetical protein
VRFAQREGCGWCNPRDGERRACCCKQRPKLPPGPAFIPEPPRRLPWPYESRGQWAAENVPDGYTFKPATDHTGAGWVRPHGRKSDARHR